MAHRKLHTFAAVGGLVLCLTCASQVARADLSVTSSIGGTPTNVGSVFLNFDSLTAGSNNGAFFCCPLQRRSWSDW